ncbi:MAG: hypothetical protein KAH01_00290 [Caldisericia bacterium]|nr:hypothetical protein [Caldisericia bacterium]
MPIPSTRQTQMDTYMGKTAGLDSNNIIDDIAYTMRIETKTGDYTVLASESGTVFVGTTADNNFTLPTREDGLIYWFIKASNHELMVTSDVSQKMTAFNDAACDSVTFTSTGEQIGCGFMVYSDGLFWNVITIPGLVAATMAPA